MACNSAMRNSVQIILRISALEIIIRNFPIKVGNFVGSKSIKGKKCPC